MFVAPGGFAWSSSPSLLGRDKLCSKGSYINPCISYLPLYCSKTAIQTLTWSDKNRFFPKLDSLILPIKIVYLHIKTMHTYVTHEYVYMWLYVYIYICIIYVYLCRYIYIDVYLHIHIYIYSPLHIAVFVHLHHTESQIAAFSGNPLRSAGPRTNWVRWLPSSCVSYPWFQPAAKGLCFRSWRGVKVMWQ